MNTDEPTLEPTLATRGPTAGTPRRVQADPHQHIPRAQVLEIRNAYLFAEARQTPLNTWITLNLVGSRHWNPIQHDSYISHLLPNAFHGCRCPAVLVVLGMLGAP